MELMDRETSQATSFLVRVKLRDLTVALFIFSVFIISNDNSLKIGSVSISSMAALIMLALFILESLTKGDFILKAHPLQRPLFLLFIWAEISLFIAWLIPSKAIPAEAYSYPWAMGLNAPSLRGLSFLLRLFLSIVSIEFVISTLTTKKKYFYILNLCLLAYSAVAIYGSVQIILYFSGIEIGNVFTEPFLRFGGYVGEPQTFGLLVLSMLFLVVSSIKYRFAGCWFSPGTLKVVLLMALFTLIFTFSLAMILGAIISFTFFVTKIKKRTAAVFFFSAGLLILIFFDFVSGALISKFFSETMSVNSRTLTWNIGYNIFSENFFTGAGIGHSPLHAKPISEMINLSFDPLDFDAYRVAILNSYLEWTAETGVIGSGLLGYTGYKIWKLGRRKNNQAHDFVKLSFGGALIAMAVSANSFGGAFYIGCFNLALALYIAGIEVFKEAK